MARRGYGSGQLIEKGPNRWQIRYYLPPDLFTGQRRRKSETFIGTKKAANKRVAELTAHHGAAGTGATLRQVVEHWRTEVGHQLGTARNYDTGMATIPPAFLDLPIADVRAAMISDLCKRVQADHSVHRARLVHAVISGGLTHAWRREWLHDNPARRVKLPTASRRAPTQPTPAQVRALFALVADDPQTYAWLVTSADSGARRGEVLGLRWSHVRLELGELRIDQALDPIDGHEKSTKTEDERTVAIGPTAVAALASWRDAQRARAAEPRVKLVSDPFVFSDALDGGTPWRPDVATKRFARLRDRAGIDGVRLYDLRHYVASEMLGAGVDAKTVAGRLGHSRVATTSDVYGHAIPARDRHAAGVLEQLTAG